MVDMTYTGRTEKTGTIDAEVMQDASEIVYYDQAGIPLYISTAKLSCYPGKRALCHWHDDIELMYIRKGQMYYYVNGKRVLLEEGGCILVNARQMHYGFSYEQQDCDFTCILFHRGLLTENKTLYQKYILPVLENPILEYLYFDAQEMQNLELDTFFETVVSLKQVAGAAFEMEIVGLIHIFWSRILKRMEFIPSQEEGGLCPDLAVQKDMVSFIYQHYTEKLALSDIAAAGKVCRNKCCVIFRRYLQQSPIAFLNAYRLKISCSLLISTSDSITNIALSCGFNHLSYYTELFSRSFGCTPSEYRDFNTDFKNNEGKSSPLDLVRNAATNPL